MGAKILGSIPSEVFARIVHTMETQPETDVPAAAAKEAATETATDHQFAR